MREKTKFRLTRTLRIAILAVLLGIVTMILVYLVTHLGEKSSPPRQSADIGPLKIDQKEKIEHFEFKGGKGNIELRANRFYVGEDKLNHLEGSVEVVDFGQKGGQKTMIFADQVAYDQEGNHFVLTGKVKIQDKDLTLVSDFFDYDKKTEVFRSDKGVGIASLRLNGFSRNLLYTRADQTLTLEDGVRLEVKPKPEQKITRPFFLRGQKLVYSRKGHQGEGEGLIEFHSGESGGSCQNLNFALSTDENFLTELRLKGKVRLELISEAQPQGTLSSGSSVLLRSRRREVEAEKVDLRMFKKSSKVRSLETRGDSRLILHSESGAWSELLSQSSEFSFDEEGELRGFRGGRQVAMVDKDKEGQELRRASGDEMSFGAKRLELRVKGGPQAPAGFTSPESDLQASEIVLFLKNDDISASGEVKAVLKPKGADKRPPGFFSGDQALFVTTRNLRHLGTPERFIFSGDIRVWQEKNMIVAQELTLFKESGEIRSAGAVRTTFPHKAKTDEPEEKVEISGNIMNYKPKNRVLSFSDSCVLLIKNYSISARTMSVLLREEDGKMKAIEASDNVVIQQESKEGRGKQAIYNVANETIVLTGSPQLLDKSKGETRGDKLTFYLSDGKIRVENLERERSETLIKREK